MERQYSDMTIDELTDQALKFSSRISETDAVIEMAHRIHALQAQLEAVRRERDDLVENLSLCKGNELAAQVDTLTRERNEWKAAAEAADAVEAVDRVGNRAHR